MTPSRTTMATTKVVVAWFMVASAASLFFLSTAASASALGVKGNPHDHQKNVHGPLVFRHSKHRRYLEGGREQLNVSATVVGEGEYITVSWSGMDFATPNDWIGVFEADVNLTLFATAIKFKFTYTNHSALHHAKVHHLQPPPIPSSGTTQFSLINYRKPIKFLYITGNLQYPQVVAMTETITFREPTKPQGVHLALGAGGADTLVYWMTGGAPSRPGVKWGYKSGQLTEWIDATYQTDMYKKTDMCDTNLQPAGRSGWWAPGAYMHATWTDIPYSTTVYYSVGDTALGWSEEFSFTSVPKADPERPTSLAAFGDMGNVQHDGSGQHSWDFNDRGEIPSYNTSALVAADDAAEIVLHIGDISYAVGFLAEWDNFFHQIQPAASAKPWMTAIGNHEQGYTKSFYPGLDSGGECGAVYNAYFPFASQNPASKLSERQPWYDFVYGNVHFVIMSTEHDYTPGTTQHEWIAETLGKVDRSVTPWLVFAGHRPMYVDSQFSQDQKVATQLQDSLEDLLVEHNVDLALWGHFHTYQRTCRVYKGQCDSEKGVQHMVIGMAGYDHSDLPPSPAAWIEYENEKNWGYLRMNFANSSMVNLQFVNDEDGQVLDDYDMVKPHKYVL